MAVLTGKPAEVKVTDHRAIRLITSNHTTRSTTMLWLALWSGPTLINTEWRLALLPASTVISNPSPRLPVPNKLRVRTRVPTAPMLRAMVCTMPCRQCRLYTRSQTSYTWHTGEFGVIIKVTRPQYSLFAFIRPSLFALVLFAHHRHFPSREF